MPRTTVDVVIPEESKFGFNTEPTQTVNTVRVPDQFGLPTPQAGSPTNVEPTIQQQLSGIESEALRIQDILNQQQANGTGAQDFASPTTSALPTYEEIYGEPIDDSQVQRDTLRLFQDQIDATNVVYDQLLNEARLEGQGRLGSQRAIAARGGILGSDFAGAQKERVQKYNTDINRGIQAERTAAIGAILGTARQTAQTEIANRRAARKQGAENYLDYLSRSQENRQSNLQAVAGAFVNQGIDPSTLDEQELATIASEAGLDTNDIINTYIQLQSSQEAAAAETALETRKTEAEISEIEAKIESGKIKTIGEGTMLYNTETGEYFKNPKTYKPDAASGLSTPNGSFTQEQIADVHTYLQENRGSDGYTDTGKYMEQLDGFVKLGGDPKDFIEEYDPDVYINPTDETRSFLQSQMRKPSSDNLFLGPISPNVIQGAITEAANQ